MTSIDSPIRKPISFKEVAYRESPIFLVLLLFTTLCAYKLNWESLWADEVYSIIDASRFPDHIALSRPLYYIILHLWMLIDNSDTWLRTLSVLFGFGTILSTYVLGRFLFDKKIGLLSAFLLSISPLFINHSQEVRMYPMGTFLGVLGTIAMAHILISGELKLSWLSGWGTARILTILTTPLNVTLLIPDVLLLFWKFRHQSKFLLRLSLPFLVVIGLIAPTIFKQVFVSAPAYIGGWTRNNPPPDITDIVGKLTRLTLWPHSIPEAQFAKLGIYIATLVLIGLVTCALIKRTHKNTLLLAAWAFLPSIPILIFSYLFTSIWINYYLLFISPYIIMILALGFVRLWSYQKKVFIAFSTVYIFAILAGLITHYSNYHHEEWRTAARIIAANEKAGDVIAVGYEKDTFLALPYHYHGQFQKRRIGPGNIITVNQNQEENPTQDIFIGSPRHRHGTLPIYTLSSVVSSDWTHELKENLISSGLVDESNIRFWLVLKNLDSLALEGRNQVKSEIQNELHIEQHWMLRKLDIFLIDDH